MEGLIEEDEFQHLLAEIPDITSITSPSDDPTFNDQTPEKSSCLPYDQSLALEFSGLSFNDEALQDHEFEFSKLNQKNPENLGNYRQMQQQGGIYTPRSESFFPFRRASILNPKSCPFKPNQSSDLPGFANWRLQKDNYHQAHQTNSSSPSIGVLPMINMQEEFMSMPTTLCSNIDYFLNDVHRDHQEFNFSAFCTKEVDREAKNSNRKNFSYSPKDFVGHNQVPQKIFPERILTRAQGVNLGRSLCPTPMNQFPTTDTRGKPCYLNEALCYAHGIHKLDDVNYRRLSILRSTHMGYSIDDVLGRVYVLAKDHNGCRFLQSIFAEAHARDIHRIFLEIIGNVAELMIDPFGNYFVQKLLEVCNADQRLCVLRNITGKPGEFQRISCDMHGTRAVQKIIETLQTKEQYSIVVSSLEPEIVELMKHINGSHVVQKCLQNLPQEYREFIYDAATIHCMELAKDRQGCCILQKCLHYSCGEQNNRLMSVIASNSLKLSQDQFGNYVVQFVIDQKVPWVTNSVHNQLEGNYASLSMQKCSSNVVEKLLKLGGEEKKTLIIQELMNSHLFLKILQDPFGNYVIQSALKECKGRLRALLIDSIRPYFRALRRNTYGKKVLLCTFFKEVA